MVKPQGYRKGECKQHQDCTKEGEFFESIKKEERC